MVSMSQLISNQHIFDGIEAGTYIQIIFVGFMLLFLAIFMVIIIKYRSKSHKHSKKNSFCETDNINSCEKSVNNSQHSMRLRIGQTIELNSDSDSSDDVLYQQSSQFVSNYIVDRVQPSASTLRQQSTSSIESEVELLSSVVLSVINEGNKWLISLIKAKNLRRSGFSPNDDFVPEGVFARIYTTYNSLSKRSDSETDQIDKDYYETNLIKSKKSKFIKFDEKTFTISSEQFPIRISLYEFDKHKTRFSIGHSFLNLNFQDNYQTNQIIELDLYHTIYKAQNESAFK